MTSALPSDFEGEAEKPLRIGRAPDNDIVLNYPMVSAYHALLSPLGEGRFTVIDLESTNGTFLNTWGEQIAPGQEVGEEDVLFFGSYRFPVRQLHPVSLWRHPREDRLPTREVLTIGRATENDLVLDYPQISSYHARFYRRNGLYAIEDLGSANGTFVNGLPIQQPTPVTVLDMIALGPYIIEIDPEGFLRIRDFRGEMRIDAQDISLLVKDRQSGRPLTLLDHISATFYPSEFVGLMGPSGAGKTTLLLVLNGYQPPSAGRVLINGYDLYHHYDLFRGTIGYVPQDDIVHKDLTVYQSLFYTARLRLPTDTPRRTIRQRVEEVLQQLNLWEHRNKQIGSPEDKVLSGGQRKRVNLGHELVTDPPILFLDEPTSGLSSKDTQNVIETLRVLADNGKTIIQTIHQPSPRVYRRLDNLLLLHHGGKIAYYGPTDPDSFTYFHCEQKNAEEIIEHLEEEDPSFWQEKYLHSPLYQEFVRQRQTEADQRVQTSEEISPRAPRRLGIGQWLLLTLRYLRIKWRDRVNSLVLLLQAPVIGGLIALIFREITSPLTGLKPAVETPLFMLTISAVWFGCSNAAREIVAERAVYLRERMINLKIPSYLFSKFVVLVGLCAIQCTIMLAITHPLLRFQGSFGEMLIVLTLTSMGGLCVGFLVSVLVNSEAAALGLLPVVLIPQMLLGGLIVNLKQSPDLITILSYTMFARWSWEGLMNIEFLARPPILRQENFALMGQCLSRTMEMDVFSRQGYGLYHNFLLMDVLALAFLIFVCLGCIMMLLQRKDLM